MDTLAVDIGVLKNPLVWEQLFCCLTLSDYTQNTQKLQEICLWSLAVERIDATCMCIIVAQIEFALWSWNFWGSM